jgi:hypothetical protein
MNGEKNGVRQPTILSSDVLHWMFIKKTQMNILVPFETSIESMTQIVSPRSRYVDYELFQLRQGQQPPVLANAGYITAIREVIKRTDISRKIWHSMASLIQQAYFRLPQLEELTDKIILAIPH